MGCSAERTGASGILALDGLIAGMPHARSDHRDDAQAWSATEVFRLAAVPPAADLELEGLWWSALVTVNGHELPLATGGFAPVRLPVGEWLRVGENTVSLRVTPPGEAVPSILDGELRSSAPLAGAPRLVMHGRAAIRSVGLIEDASGEVVAVAQVEGAPEGSTVAFRAVRDGAIVADLGSAPVHGGLARTSPVGWPAPEWTLGAGEPALTWVIATVNAGSTLLDTASFRTAPRRLAVTPAGLSVAGQPRVLAGLRWSGERDGNDLAALAATGLDALELHGQPLTESLLDQADEAGIGVVIVPRCAGRLRTGGGTRRPVGGASSASWSDPELAAQDARAISAALRHPSVLLWTLEADQSEQSARVAALGADPLARPIVGREIPRIYGSSTGSPAGGWQIEFTADIVDPEGQLGAEIAAGAIGGILPTPTGGARAGWEARVRAALSSANLPPAGVRVGPARVDVGGLTPGEVVWVHAEGTSRLGAVAGADGVAHLSLWHTGGAELESGGAVRSVQLRRGETLRL